MKTRTREAGYIFTITRSKKYHQCAVCPMPIQPRDEYLIVEKGGGGMSWATHPDRIHNTEEDKELYVGQWGATLNG